MFSRPKSLALKDKRKKSNFANKSNLNTDSNGFFGRRGNDNHPIQINESKSSLSEHREQYYTTARKPQSQSPCRDSSGALERIPEYSEDIYPYATFHLPDQENMAGNPSRHGVLTNPAAAAAAGLYDSRDNTLSGKHVKLISFHWNLIRELYVFFVKF